MSFINEGGQIGVQASQYIVQGNSIVQHAQDPLGQLLYAADAPFNSYARQHERPCLHNTREDLLHEIYSWAEGPDERCIFWLSGLAGTGKSTIARTVAHRYFDEKRLAASFFFSRGGGDVGYAERFVTSIAVQLADNIPASRQHICDAITKRSNIAQQSLHDQWQHLVCRPLSKLREPGPYILVVDALDECDNDKHIQMIVQLMAEARSLLRVFITSRPEVPIRREFGQIADREHKDFVLHNILPVTVNQDIATFLKHHLRIIAKDLYYHADWPGAEVIMQLVQSACGLFIWAATACLFIEEGGQLASDRLHAILKDSSSTVGSPDYDSSSEDSCTDHHFLVSPEEQLDSIYLTVLRSPIQRYTKQERKKWCGLLRETLGAIVLLNSPLPASSLAQLLCIPVEDVQRTLYELHSILDVPQDPARPIRLHHPSFRDFLLNKKRCRDEHFWIDGKSTNKTLASRCLKLLSGPNGLCQDMCGLLGPGVLRSEIDDGTVAGSLPPELQYACRYWISHLIQSQQHFVDGDTTHLFLQKHLLHWLEAMSLMRELSRCVHLLDSLQALAGQSASSVSTFLHDAKRFILRFQSVLADAPLQIYCSALVFAPKKSLIRQIFIGQVLQRVDMLSMREADWDACRSTLEGHSSLVTAVAFSPDGQLVASASHDKTVRLWEAATGKCRSTLKGHSDYVTAVAFSPDGQLVASASYDKTVRLWEAATGTCHSTLKGHSDYVTTVAFLPDRQLIASASYDKTVRLWEAATGTCCSTLKGHSDYIIAVAFSPDGQIIASASYDKTVRLWKAATGRCCSVLEGHSSLVMAVTFSPDGQMVASASGDKTVRLWEVATGTCRSTLEGHSSLVAAVAFSPDGQLVASASRDKTVRLWEAAKGTCCSTLEGHSSLVTAVAFSPDGQLVASASRDKTVRLWEAATGTCRSMLGGHSDYVIAVAFSPDGQLVASASRDKTVRLWEAATETYYSTLESHSREVTAVAFSPDGQLVASASRDKTVRLWEAATGTCRSTLEGHSDYITAVAFSLDGQMVASASYDKTVRLWEAATGTCCSTLEGHSDYVTTVAFSKNGQVLHTNAGEIPLSSPSIVPLPSWQQKQSSNIQVQDQWILRNQQRFLWLPSEYRSVVKAVHENIACLGLVSGRVVLIRII